MALAIRINDSTYVIEDNAFFQVDQKVRIPKGAVGVEVEWKGERLVPKEVPVYDVTSLTDEMGKAQVVAAVPFLNVTILKTEKHYVLVKGLITGRKEVVILGGKVFFSEAEALNAAKDDPDVALTLAMRLGTRDAKVTAVLALAKAGRCEEAIKVFESLSEKYPDEALAAAECYVKLGNRTEALKIYSVFAPEKYRELEELIKAEINSALDEFDRTENVKALVNLLKVLPNYDAPSLKLAWYYYNKGNKAEALKYFEEAVRRNPSYINELFLAKALIEAGQPKRAYEILTELEAVWQTGYINYLKGEALSRMNAPGEASKEFSKACWNGILEACMRLKPYMVNQSRSSDDPDQWLGHVVYGYRIERYLGSGGMGYVFEATKAGKKFAMKVMKREFRLDELLKEVAKMQEVTKGNRRFVRIVANFVDENLQDSLSYPPAIVMEYMAGGDLKAVLIDDEYKTLRSSDYWPAVVAKIFSMVAEGVSYLHSLGYVHADLKPGNILFTSGLPKFGPQALEALEKGEVEPKIGDLGSVTKIGTAVVHYTPYYAHPQQRFGGPADPKFDLYSLTVSLYVSLTNSYPWPEWLEREIEEAVTNPSMRDQAYQDFLEAKPRLDYVPEEFRDLIYDGLKGLITIREFKDLLERAQADIIRSVESPLTI
jgi:Flp pilus assembly protein TadD